MSELCVRARQAHGAASSPSSKRALNEKPPCRWQNGLKKVNAGLHLGDLGPRDPTASRQEPEQCMQPSQPRRPHFFPGTPYPHRQTDRCTHAHCPLTAGSGSTPPCTPSSSHLGLPTPTHTAPTAPRPTFHTNIHTLPLGTGASRPLLQPTWSPVASDHFPQKEKRPRVPGAAGAEWGQTGRTAGREPSWAPLGAPSASLTQASGYARHTVHPDPPAQLSSSGDA